jgi:hypothetical protein
MTLTERTDYFNDAYRPFEVTLLSNSFNLQILNTIRDYMPSGARNESPFCLRSGPGKLKEVYLKSNSGKKLPPNPSVYGLPSGSSSTSSELSLIDSDDDPDRSDDASNFDDLSTHPTAMNTSSFMMNNTRRLSVEESRAEFFSRFQVSAYPMIRYLSELDAYPPEQLTIETVPTHDLCEPCEPNMSKNDLHLYKSYVKVGRSNDSRLNIDTTTDYASFFQTSKSDERIRQEYTSVFESMVSPTPNEADFKLYCNHVAGRSITIDFQATRT